MKTLRLRKPTNEINARVEVPGSKSYTNRALIMAALANGTSQLNGASLSKDSLTMIKALSALGVTITPHADNPLTAASSLIVTGLATALTPLSGTIDVGPAGTAMRFLTALCAAIPECNVVLQGSERMHARPIEPLVEALRQAGAEISYLGRKGCPPLKINSKRRLDGQQVEIDGSISSQFVSALLLAAPLFQDGLTLRILGQLASTSYLDMTLQGLSDFGLKYERPSPDTIVIPAGQSYQARTYQIEGDASGASYLWAIAAISAGSVRVDNINPDSIQGDVIFPRLLEQMGCAVEYSPRSIKVTGTPDLKPIDVDMTLMPDTAQTLAVIAACAQGTTRITGLKTLRVKETDRIAAIQAELAKCGIQSDAGADQIQIHGGQPQAARIATYDDHRMAMSFAALASRIDGMMIEEPTVVEKSFPDFWQTLDSIGISSEMEG